MNNEDLVAEQIKKSGITEILMLPCEKISRLIDVLSQDYKTITLNREENGLGIATGMYLAGHKPLMLIQSTGIGNLLTTLCSLNLTFGIPLPIVASYRGIEKSDIIPQKEFGGRLEAILEAMEIDYIVIKNEREIADIGRYIDISYATSKPYLILLHPQLMNNDEIGFAGEKELRFITSRLNENMKLIVNIGHPSRMIYSMKDRDNNFYMLGSLGQASMIGLGYALSKDEKVVIIEGDGATLMANPYPLLARYKPKNLTIITLLNGAWGSTGHQKLDFHTKLNRVAQAHALNVKMITTKNEMIAMMNEINMGKSSKAMIYFVKTEMPKRSNYPHINLSPQKIRDRFMGKIILDSKV